VKGGSERQPPVVLGKNQQQNDNRDQAQNNKTDLNVAQDQAGGRHPVAGQRAVAFFDFFFSKVTGNDGRDGTQQRKDCPSGCQ